jgi:Glycosyl transferase family 2
LRAPAFSVVIPAYNAAATIGTTIRSVLAQTLSDLELIVVDDGSTDRSVAIAEALASEDGRVRLIRQANQGPSTARNAGISEARGPLVSILDSDDLWMPHYLEAMVQALESDPGAGFAYTDAWVLHDRSGRIFRRTPFDDYPPPPAGASTEEILRRLVEQNFVMCSVTMRRAVVVELGAFDTSMQSAEDYDLWIRIVAAGHGAAAAQGRPLIQRDRPTSISKDEAFMRDGMRTVMQHVLASDVPASVREAAERRLAALDRHAQPATAKERMGAVAAQLHRAAIQAVNRIWRGRYLRDEPPAEVAAAFPDLSEL